MTSELWTPDKARSVGVLSSDRKDRTQRIHLPNEDYGPPRSIGHLTEDWEGRVAAVATPPATVSAPPAVRAWMHKQLGVNRPQWSKPMTAVDAYRAQGMALTQSLRFWETELDKIDATQLAVNVAADTFDIRLLDNTLTPNEDTDGVWADFSSGEITGTGYTAEGLALSGLSVSISAGMNWDATDPTWPTSTITSHGCVIVDDTLAGDPVICLLWFGGPISSTAATFTVQFAAGGFLQYNNA